MGGERRCFIQLLGRIPAPCASISGGEGNTVAGTMSFPNFSFGLRAALAPWLVSRLICYAPLGLGESNHAYPGRRSFLACPGLTCLQAFGLQIRRFGQPDERTGSNHFSWVVSGDASFNYWGEYQPLARPFPEGKATQLPGQCHSQTSVLDCAPL